LLSSKYFSSKPKVIELSQKTFSDCVGKWDTLVITDGDEAPEERSKLEVCCFNREKNSYFPLVETEVPKSTLVKDVKQILLDHYLKHIEEEKKKDPKFSLPIPASTDYILLRKMTSENGEPKAPLHPNKQISNYAFSAYRNEVEIAFQVLDYPDPMLSYSESDDVVSLAFCHWSPATHKVEGLYDVIYGKSQDLTLLRETFAKRHANEMPLVVEMPMKKQKVSEKEQANDESKTEEKHEEGSTEEQKDEEKPKEEATEEKKDEETCEKIVVDPPKPEDICFVHVSYSGLKLPGMDEIHEKIEKNTKSPSEVKTLNDLYSVFDGDVFAYYNAKEPFVPFSDDELRLINESRSSPYSYSSSYSSYGKGGANKSYYRPEKGITIKAKTFLEDETEEKTEDKKER